jgi:hypothetical protein
MLETCVMRRDQKLSQYSLQTYTQLLHPSKL